MSSATITVIQRAGLLSTTDETKTAIKFLGIDSNTATITSYPIKIPNVGTKYSYEVYLAFKCTGAPTTQVTNFLVWTNGTIATGLNITANSTQVADYIPPKNCLSDTGTRVDLADYVTGSRLSVSGTVTNINDLSDWLVLQLEVISTATQATEEAYTLSYSYDES